MGPNGGSRIFLGSKSGGHNVGIANGANIFLGVQMWWKDLPGPEKGREKMF